MLPNDPQFQDLLLIYSQETNDKERKKLEDAIWQKNGTENTVFVLDMFGFSLLTRKYGIVHYLSMIRRMQLTVEPIITGHGGRIIKFEADNCFAILPDSRIGSVDRRSSFVFLWVSRVPVFPASLQ